MGLYDPDYAQYSLGIYTMLCEIQYGIEQRKKYYYPGYVVPGYKKFDYKLRVGTMEFYDVPSESWKHYDELETANLPAEKLRGMLSALHKTLEEKADFQQNVDLPFLRQRPFWLRRKRVFTIAINFKYPVTC